MLYSQEKKPPANYMTTMFSRFFLTKHIDGFFLTRARGVYTSRLQAFFFSLGGLCLAGCSLIPPATPDPTKYYVLTSPEPGATLTRSSGAVRVGLRSLDLPGYLRNTKTMVVRLGANEIRYQDYARWAEPLDAGLSRVVRDELARSELISAVERPPYLPEALPKYEVNIRMTLCEGVVAAENHGEVKILASYEIVSIDNRKTMIEKSFTAPAKNWDGRDYGVLARLLSESTAALADDIANSLPK